MRMTAMAAASVREEEGCFRKSHAIPLHPTLGDRHINVVLRQPERKFDDICDMQ